MIFQCRFCGKRTDPALAVRFSPPFIYCYASAEIITFIGNPETSGKDQLLSQFLEDIEYQFEFNKVTLTFLAKFFNECAEARSQKYIKSVVGSLENDLVSQLFNYAIHSSRLSFDKASLVKSRFLEVANLLGIDRSTAERVADALSTPERQDALDWWTVLGVAIDSSIENIKAAYLAESRKFHPDYSYGLPEHEKQENARKMKEVNLAFELAKVAVEKRSKAGGVKREVSATSFGGDGNSAKSTADKNVNGVNPVAASVSLSSFRVDPSVATMESGKPVTSAKVARGSNFEDFITALVFVGIALAIFILPWVVDRKSTAKRPLVHNAEVTTEDLDYSDRDSSWETVAKSLPKESGINMRPGQKSADTVFQSPVGEPIVCFDQPDLLKISDEPIHAKTFVYDNWFENVPNYPQRYLALDHIYNGEVYFRDRGFRQLQFSLYTITDADLEKVVRYIGQGTGSFLNELLPARDWTMTVADKPVRGSLVGLLNRVVVLRWELKREYVLVGLDQLASDDASYVLFHCEK